jgi:hypothetical protein
VGAKTFVLEEGVWMDTSFDPHAMPTQKVVFGSQAYFDLLAARSMWGDYLALGERVVFVGDSGGASLAYEIVPGEGDPVQFPPTTTAAPPRPTDAPVDADPPTPTAAARGGLPSAANALCLGSLAACGVVLAALRVGRRRRRDD